MEDTGFEKKILFTIAMLVVFRVGAFIPVPGINIAVIKDIVQRRTAGFL